jgi:hypothetical protein
MNNFGCVGKVGVPDFMAVEVQVLQFEKKT